ncbi:uncharacterized protein LOC120924703 isoform X2 [Rana temporaria]|uniref:uncharacterized protein LOC120924703 isoform X2 n=1 Tax=Rana temporaria TaxID=8407 RepID=UPI001AACCA0C|nr:uncharacterized protein LOC120924703 isoform X2 [Rana temporaria]
MKKGGAPDQKCEICNCQGNENGDSSDEEGGDSTGKKDHVDDGDDVGDKEKFSTTHILLPCLALVVILVICSFLLWSANRKNQRNLEIGGASDRQVPLEEKMGSISDKDLRNNEHVYSRPSHIYQEIPATQEDPAEVLQNPLYISSGPPSQDERPAEGQYSLLQLPTPNPTPRPAVTAQCGEAQEI